MKSMKILNVGEIYNGIVDAAKNLYGAGMSVPPYNFIIAPIAEKTFMDKMDLLKPNDIDSVERVLLPAIIDYYTKNTDSAWALVMYYNRHPQTVNWQFAIKNLIYDINKAYNAALKNLGYIESDDEDDDVMEIEIEEDE